MEAKPHFPTNSPQDCKVSIAIPLLRTHFHHGGQWKCHFQCAITQTPSTLKMKSSTGGKEVKGRVEREEERGGLMQKCFRPWANVLMWWEIICLIPSEQWKSRNFNTKRLFLGGRRGEPKGQPVMVLTSLKSFHKCAYSFRNGLAGINQPPLIPADLKNMTLIFQHYWLQTPVPQQNSSGSLSLFVRGWQKCIAPFQVINGLWRPSSRDSIEEWPSTTPKVKLGITAFFWPSPSIQKGSHDTCAASPSTGYHPYDKTLMMQV